MNQKICFTPTISWICNQFNIFTVFMEFSISLPDFRANYNPLEIVWNKMKALINIQLWLKTRELYIFAEKSKE